MEKFNSKEQSKPFLKYSIYEFIDIFRLRKVCVVESLDDVGECLEAKEDVSTFAFNQLLIALRFYAIAWFH